MKKKVARTHISKHNYVKTMYVYLVHAKVGLFSQLLTN